MFKKFTSSTRKTETGLQVESESRGFKVIMDEPVDEGGADTGMNPVEMQLCAFGGCLTILTSMLAEKMRLRIDDIRVDVEGETDPRGLAGVKGVRPGYQNIRYTFRFRTEESLKKIEKLVNMVESLCPIHDTLSHPVNVVREDIVIE